MDDFPALARVLQPVIDALTAQGINKIVLSSHLQQYQFEQQLAPLQVKGRASSVSAYRIGPLRHTALEAAGLSGGARQ